MSFKPLPHQHYQFADYGLKQILQLTLSLFGLELMVSRQLTVGAAVFSAVRCVTPVAWLCLGLQ